MSYYYLKFLNLQYWYCVIYSLFGGKCTTTDYGTPDIPVPRAPTVPSTGASASRPGFWDWLFGVHSGNTGTAVDAPVAHSGFFGSLFDGILFVVGIVGAILSFLWSLYSILAYMVSAILALAILTSLFGIAFVRFRELSTYSTLPPAAEHEHPLRSRWQSLLDDSMSSDPKRWREGIIEADVMLGELLGNLGYAGASTADKVRLVPEDAFVTLPLGLEAHRVRNFVSARSSSFILTQREAFRVMKLYEQVFEEFDFI